MQKQRTGYVPKHVRERSARRRAALRRQGYDSYSAYLTSPHWRALKARYRASDRPQACICGETEGVHLHHLTYDRIGDERLTDLLPLCRLCHELIHVLERRGEIGLDMSGLENDERARIGRAYLAALAVASERDVAEYRVARTVERQALPYVERVRRVRVTARAKHINVSSKIRLIEALHRGNEVRVLRALNLLEQLEERLNS